MKAIPREELIVRNSFKLPFLGGEIWSEELDGLNIHIDIVIDKFLKDMETIKRPSSPALIAIHLKGTMVNEALAKVIVSELTQAGHSVRKVVFIGLGMTSKRIIEKTLKRENALFAYSFIRDYEKAKEWLVNKKS